MSFSESSNFMILFEKTTCANNFQICYKIYYYFRAEKKFQTCNLNWITANHDLSVGVSSDF